MIIRLLKHKRTILISWIASYVLFMIVPIIIGVFIYNQSVEVITDEVNKVHYASLNQLKMTMDTMQQKIETIGINILINGTINRVKDINDEFTPAQAYSLVEIQKELQRYKTSNDFIEDISIYFNYKDFVLSDQAKYRSEDISYFAQTYFNMSRQEWLDYININQYKKFKVFKTDTNSDERTHKLIYIQALHFIMFDPAPATLVITVDVDTINQSIVNLSWRDTGTVYIINEDEYIQYGQIDIMSDILEDKNIDNTRPVIKSIDDQEMMIINIDSDLTLWKYFAFIPSEVYLEKIQYMQSVINIYAIIYLVIGGSLAYLLARKNYSPLKKLVQKYISQIGGSNDNKIHEYRFLEDSLKKLLDERLKMDSRLKQNNEAMRNNYIIRLLKGRIKNPKSDGGIYNVKLDGQYYLCMAFSIRDMNNLFFEENVEQNDETINLAYFVINNIVEEIINQHHACYMAEIDGMMVSLINIKDEEVIDINKAYEEMLTLAKKAKHYIENEFGIMLSISISNLHVNIKDIPVAFREAMECIEYITFFDEHSTVLVYHSIEKSDAENFSGNLGLEKEKLLINSICSQDYKSAIDIINEIFSTEFADKKYSIQLIKCWIFGLIGFVVKAIGGIDSGAEEKIFENNDLLKKLLDAKSVKEIKNNFIEIFQKLETYYVLQSKDMAPTWFDKVVSYIDGNYHIQNINLEAVANAFEISPSYLSQTFKKYKHISVLEYIHKLRLDEAKRLLKEGYTIKEIAERVGYNNSLALNRAFKRYEGITPGRYRTSEQV